jgi:predicted metal-dependent enzyme (double-stranded beta helix superfamily)
MAIVRLRNFVEDFTRLLDSAVAEADLLRDGRSLLHALVSHDDWLPEAFARCVPERYQQNLLHCDGAARFSIVSFVWAPGQRTAIHDHTVWGLVGVLRGEETSQRFVLRGSGRPPAAEEKTVLRPGDVEVLLPSAGDIHQVTNSGAGEPAVSIHVYGGNIGAIERHEFDSETGVQRRFVSGYSNTTLPNLWS